MRGPTFLFLASLAATAAARVPIEDATRLHTVLTPMGAERAGNMEGTIPPWLGGLKQAPDCYQGPSPRLCDPFPDDKPLFTITAKNVDRFRDRLSAGQIEMFQRHPATYKLDIYRARRSAAFPDFVYDATSKNALNAELVGNGESLARATVGAPFPIPRAGLEAVWNHKLRYRGVGLRRWNTQAVVREDGAYSVMKLREDLRFAHSVRGATTESLKNVMSYLLQVTVQPIRAAGQITLVHETLDQLREPRRAWQYNPGQRRLHRADALSYDAPVNGAEGLRTADQGDMFNGAGDRYVWKIVGKREVFIPANAYRIHAGEHKVRDIVRRGHLNQDLARYELHRCWIVEGDLKRNTSHVYGKRVLYLDEDSWQIALVDLYDRRGGLWRWQEAHTLQFYGQDFPLPVLETAYDLSSDRYLVQAMNNEDPETVVREFDAAYFEPGSVRRQGIADLR